MLKSKVILEKVSSAGHLKFIFFKSAVRNLQPNNNFINPQPQVRNCTFKSLSQLPQVRNDASGLLNPQSQFRNFVILKVRHRNDTILKVLFNYIIFKVRIISPQPVEKVERKRRQIKQITIKKLCIGCTLECKQAFFFLTSRAGN